MTTMKTIANFMLASLLVSFANTAIANNILCNVNASGSSISPSTIICNNGKKMLDLTLQPYDRLKIACVGRGKCSIGQFLIKTNYTTVKDCPLSSKGSSNCAKFDNNWKIATIYSDKGNTAVIIRPFSLPSGYKYPLKNLGSRPLSFTQQ